MDLLLFFLNLFQITSLTSFSCSSRRCARLGSSGCCGRPSSSRPICLCSGRRRRRKLILRPGQSSLSSALRRCWLQTVLKEESRWILPSCGFWKMLRCYLTASLFLSDSRNNFVFLVSFLLNVCCSRYFLRPEDAEEVNRIWEHGTPRTVDTLRQCIEERPSFAVRSPTGELAAWALTRHDGSIGVVVVKLRSVNFVCFFCFDRCSRQARVSAARTRSVGGGLSGQAAWLCICVHF